MDLPRAFISFDIDHNEKAKFLFVGQAKNEQTPFNIADWSCKEALPQKQWEALINDKINKCDMVIVLVGKNMATATGVLKEISFAHDNDVPVFGVFVDGADTSSTLPAGLSRGRVIEWKWDAIADAIEQVMKEGKHA